MEVDSAYANFFGDEGEAAVLACDELGLVPSDLLHETKDSFERDKNDTQNTVLVRYTLAERTRQNNFRKLLAIKNRLIVEGRVSKMWQERSELFPDAPGVPKISRAALERAAAEMDTESDDDGDNRIDERGLVKPPPLFGPQSSSRGGGHRENNTAMSSSPKPRSVPAVILPDAKNDRDFVICRKDDRDVIVLRPQAPAPPPYLPPLPYARRNSTNLGKEEAELEEYRRFLLRFAHKSTWDAKECKNFDVLYRAKAASEKNTEENLNHSSPHGVEDESKEGGQGSFRSMKASPFGDLETDNKTSSSNNNKNNEKGGQSAQSESLGKQKSRHERQLEAYVRMALLDITRNSSDYKKWTKFRKEMDDYHPMGTLAAELHSRINFGCMRSHEDYVREIEERAEKHAQTLGHERSVQDKLSAHCETKHQQAEENLKKIRNEHGELFVEAMRMHRVIAEQNEKREDRRRGMKQQRSRAALEKKELRASEFSMKKAHGAKDKRYEHDQEEIFRRLLKEKVHDMDVKKKWDAKSVTNGV